MEKNGDLPVNLNLVIEGEEEIGSENLGKFLQQNRDALKCEVVVVSDTGMIAPAHTDHELRSPRSDCAGVESHRPEDRFAFRHLRRRGGQSGSRRLARLLASLHDNKGTFAIAGFYDEVQPLQGLGAPNVGQNCQSTPTL